LVGSLDSKSRDLAGDTTIFIQVIFSIRIINIGYNSQTNSIFIMLCRYFTIN